ncbi:MAG: ATP-binding protein [Muribaculaceae bacterium]|nr:ATP-binding protein [Muribaculaceae bacterium]
MILSIRLKNFFSLRDEVVLDFTADVKSRKQKDYLPENLIEFEGDKFVNIIGLFGSNAAGKSNIIKAMDFCRRLVLTSHQNNEGYKFDFEPFKFDTDKSSEFSLSFVTEGKEYEYSFKLLDGKVLGESLYHFPNGRRARIFSRENYDEYIFAKGSIHRPKEVESNTGPTTLFISRASSMNRPVARTIYRFFLNEISIGLDNIALTDIDPIVFEVNKMLILKAFEVSDSDITDIQMTELSSGQYQLRSFHRENPAIAFNFEREESEGTKRLLLLIITLLTGPVSGTTFFLDEFDLKLHLRLAEFILDVVRATRSMQMVFTSHNPLLIETSKLRLEQIVIVNKNAEGNSEFVPLCDYEGLTKRTDVQKAYLQGRFDGVPYTGDAYTMISDVLGEK